MSWWLLFKSHKWRSRLTIAIVFKRWSNFIKFLIKNLTEYIYLWIHEQRTVMKINNDEPSRLKVKRKNFSNTYQVEEELRKSNVSTWYSFEKVSPTTKLQLKVWMKSLELKKIFGQVTSFDDVYDNGFYEKITQWPLLTFCGRGEVEEEGAQIWSNNIEVEQKKRVFSGIGYDLFSFSLFSLRK